MNEMINIIVAEPIHAIGIGMKAILEQVDHVTVVDIVENVGQAAEMITVHNPHFLVADLTVPFHENLHIIRNIKINYSDLHIIAYIDKEDDHLYNDLLAAGVSGVFVISADPQQIRRLLYSILDGDTVIPLWLVDAYRSRKSEDPVIGMEHLSDRDKQILQCVSNGYTNSEIAAELHLSVRSIETNLSKIYKKLHVKSRLEAVKQGYAVGFIK